MPYQLLVDSASDIPPELAKSAGLVMVPMPVNIGDKTYLEGVDIHTEEFYKQFDSFKELPKTSQPNPAVLLEQYEEILSLGDEVVAVHLSSGMSSTVATAEMLRDRTSAPERVHIIDSLDASFGFGVFALIVGKILATGIPWPEAEAKILAVRNKRRSVFTIDSLEYLVKGGRVSKMSGFIGGLLDVKPVLHVTPDGRLEPFAKVRSRRAAIRKMAEVMEQEASFLGEQEDQIVGISQAACLEDAQFLEAEIRRRTPVKNVQISEIGCVIGSHTGPGGLALFYQV